MPTPQSDPDATVIENVLLFDGTRFLEDRQVLIQGGLVTQVAGAVRAPAGARRVDGSGKTLIPGLIDAHTHSWGDALSDALRFGVTTQIDMFTALQYLDQARPARESLEATERSDLFSAGTLVTAAGGHGTQFGIAIPTFENAEEADAFVEARLAEGSDFIKLVIEDGSAYGRGLPTLDAARVHAVIKAAHARDVLAVVHVSTLAGAHLAVEAGADGLVHIFHDKVVDDALIKAIGDRDFFVIPTLAIIAGFGGTDAHPISRDDERLSPAQIASLERRFPMENKGALTRALESVRKLHEAGIPILAGTDAPNPGTAYGASMHAELELLTRAGLDTAEVLAAATALPAEHFPLGKRGRIAEGMRADLLLIDGDPRKDLTATASIVELYKNGHRIEPSNPGSGEAATALAAGSISDFEQEGVEASRGFGWQPTTDEIAGGTSTVAFEKAGEGGNGFVRIDAEVKAGFAFPWSGVIYFPGAAPMAPVDASGIGAVRFRARGDAGRYRLMFFIDGQMMPITETFDIEETWREISISLDALSSRERLTGMAWVAGPGVGEVRFDLDDVALEPAR
ncbi:hypothetical protein ABI59_00625 [Acidobacteria bacterium Mor1]|nr:hypothetical protein ABI59_00625 [Acidobacteria bacterium Mor1]